MKKTPKPRDTVQRLKEAIHKQPAVFAVYLALRLIVLAELVMSIIRGEYESAFICLLVLALFILFYPVLSGLPISSAYGALLKWMPTWYFTY